MKKFHRALCLLFGLGSLFSYAIAAFPAGIRGCYYILLHIVLSLIMMASLLTSRHVDPREQRWTLLAGIVARMLLIGVPSFTTTDVERYLWDGHAAISGIDPYRVAPNEALGRVELAWFKGVVSGKYVTIYPPGALSLFALCAKFGIKYSFLAWKILVLSASVGTLLLIWGVLRGRSRERFLPIAAFSPLLVLEAGIGAHVDVFAGLAVAVALAFLVRRRSFFAGLALGTGGLIKFLPLAALVPFAIADRRRIFPLLFGAFSILVLGYSLALIFGFHPLGSLIVFFEKWRFGSPLYSALGVLIGHSSGLLEGGLVVSLALLISATAVFYFQRYRVPWMLAVPLLASPVVFPWYLTPVVVATVIEPSAFILAWATTLPLTYEVIDRYDSTGVWRTAAWPLWTIGLSWTIGIALDFRSNHKKRAQ